jgi:hypothetical protein
MTLRENLESGKLQEVKKLEKLTIIYKDLFDMKGLYEIMKEWMVEEGFVDENGDGKDAFETYYWERRKPGTTGKEFTIWWRVTKGSPSSPWYTYKLYIDFIGIHLQTVETIHEGKKIRINDGEVNVVIQPVLILDEDNKFVKDNFLFKSLVKPFRLRMIKKDFSWNKKFLESIAERLQIMIKDYLDLNQYQRMSEPMHPTRGFGFK